jgi:dTDP-glucose pyrophosphorylase
MELIIFEKEAYYKMMSEITTLIKAAIKDAQLEVIKSKTEIDWIDTDEAMELLNVRSKTKMQQLRNNGDILFTKYGRKIKYSRKSIVDLLNRNIKDIQ